MDVSYKSLHKSKLGFILETRVDEFFCLTYCNQFPQIRMINVTNKIVCAEDNFFYKKGKLLFKQLNFKIKGTPPFFLGGIFLLNNHEA